MCIRDSYVTGLKNAMFDNYSYFARSLRYVINVTHHNLRYGASRLFITPYSPGLGQKKSPKFARSLVLSATLSSCPRRRQEEDIPPIDNKRKRPTSGDYPS